jgi:replicative DNA helicase
VSEPRKRREKTEQSKKSYTPDPHRLLPQAPDSEKGLLSSFLISPREIGGLCAEKRITPEWFAIPSHGLIYRRLLEMWDDNEPIDFVILTQRLRDLDELDQCGGAAFVTELFTFLPTAANAAYYIDILEEALKSRGIINVGTEFAARAYDERDNPEELLDEFEGKVLSIRSGITVPTLGTAKQATVESLQVIEDLYSRKGSVSGLATGFADLDRLTDGMHPGEMIVIAARPSQGKTALAMNIVETVALDLEQPVGVFSLEMTRVQLVTRMLCSRARVNLARVRDGFLSDRDFPALQVAAIKVAASKLYIDDASSMSIQELRAKARRLYQQHKIKLLVIDYLQLLRSTSKRAERDRQLEVSEISAGLKGLAKELGIPLVVLCQISRKFDERGLNGRPRLSDLRESGSIEQDADTVSFIVRPEVYAETDEEKEILQGKAELIVAKQRNGPIGDVDLTFLKEYTRFETRAKGCDEENPPLSTGSFPL